MSRIRIEKDIFMRDRFNVKRREWIAGQTVDSYVYHAVLKTNRVVNPEDLPIPYDEQSSIPSLHNTPLETKVLPEPEVVETEEVVEEETEEQEKPKKKYKPKKKAKK